MVWDDKHSEKLIFKRANTMSLIDRFPAMSSCHQLGRYSDKDKDFSTG